MNIGFHTNQLSLRGTEVSMYDYAKYNEEILGNKSYVVTKHPDIYKYSDQLAIEKFQNRFNVFFYKTNDELQKIITDNQTDVFYAQKAGMIDDVVSKSCKTVVHAVFQYCEPHGDVYAYISEWLGTMYHMSYVPYMVDLPNENGNLRQELGIPEDALVYGRHGGRETFDIDFVKKIVVQEAKNSSKTYFLFLNTDKFSDETTPNIIYLDATADMIRKTQFINTCDAMLHARYKGETFGLAVAEFSIRNKPVISFGNSQDMAHARILGERILLYSSASDLSIRFLQIKDYVKNHTGTMINWNKYDDYSPLKVMEKFKKIFLS